MKKNLSSTDHPRSELENLRHQCSTIQHISKIGFVDWDLESDKMVWSEQIYEMLGLDSQKLPEPDFKTLLDLVHHEDREDLYKKLQKSIRKVAEFKTKARMIRADGTVIWIQAEGFVELDRTGNPKHMSGIIRDISRREQVELALNESETHYHQLFNSLPYGGEILDLKGKILDCSPSTTKMLGYTKAELVGKHITQFVDEDTLNSFKHNFYKVGRGESLQLEACMIKKNGAKIDVLRAAQPLLNAAGEVMSVLVLNVDITESKVTEARLLESEKRFKKLSELSFEGILIHQNGIAIDVNKTLMNMFNYSRAEMIGVDIIQLVIPAQYRDTIYNGLAKETIAPYEVMARKKDGTLFPVEIAAKRITSENTNYRVTTIRDISERKQAEKKLQESELKFRLLAQYAHDWEYMRDPDGNYIYLSPSCERITGFTSAEFMAKPNLILSLISEEYKESFGHHYRDEKNQDTPAYSSEFSIIHKDGTVRWLEHNCRPVFDDGGNYIGRRGNNHDITERKQVEENLKASKEFLTSIFESVQDGISILNPDLTIKHVNKTMNNWYEVNFPLEGKKCYEVYHNSDKPCDPCPSLRCFESGKTESNIVRGLPGSPVEFMELYSYPIKDSDSNKVTEVVEYVRNITNRKQAENSLRESEEKYRLIVENANDGIEITQDDKIIYTNARFASMLGYSVETLKNIHFSVLFTEQALQELDERQKIRKANKRSHANYETTFYQKDGSIIDVAVKSKIIDYKGKPATFAIIRDITEQKQANKKITEALREAKQALDVKDQFIANISHEIRTPLNSILGFSDLLRIRFSEAAGPSEKKIFTYMKASSDRLLHTVDSILNMSQLAAGSIKIHPERLDLGELVISVIQELKLLAEGKQLEFRYKLAKQPSIVFADKYSIHQALANLTENAIKYTNEGSVELKLEQKDGQTVLSVIDTGIGISKEHQQRIFEPYTQESEGFTKNFQGIGLGLALTVRYLELNHVKLNLVSTKDVGSTFTLTFPIFKEKNHD